MDAEVDEAVDHVAFDFEVRPDPARNSCNSSVLGCLIAVAADVAQAQPPPGGRRGGRGSMGRGPRTLSARVHIGGDGTITVMTGKVEGGQGARAEFDAGRRRGAARSPWSGSADHGRHGSCPGRRRHVR